MINIRIILIQFAILVSSCTFSQNAKEKSILQKVQADFSRFTPNDMLYLIPFQDADSKKYGYIDARSKEMVLTAEYDELNLFEYSSTSATYNDIPFIIRVDDKQRLAVSIGIWIPELEAHRVVIAENLKDASLPKGFTVTPAAANKTLSVKRHSSIYHTVQYPFQLNGKYYAIAYMNGMYGIIDTEGETLSNFNFQHTVLKSNDLIIQQLPPSPQELWFYTKDANNEEIFISTLGNKKMIGKNLTSQQELYHSFGNRPQHTFGYVLYANGVLDFVYMRWQIAPQQGVKITDIEYTSSNHLQKQRIESRTMADTYFKASNKKQIYYIDTDGYEYIK